MNAINWLATILVIGIAAHVHATAEDEAMNGFRILTSSVICKELGTPERPAMRYLAWPTIGKTKEGELIVVFSGDRAAHCCPFGKTQMIRSRDDGRTWSSPGTINETVLDDRDAGLCVMKDGTMVVSWFNLHFPAHQHAPRRWPHVGTLVVDSWESIQPDYTPDTRREQLGFWTCRSTNDGNTWEEPARVPLRTPHGPIELQDGRLLFMGTDPEQDLYGVAQSEDRGRTWKLLAKIEADPEFKGIIAEPHVVECEDGKLLGLFILKLKKAVDARGIYRLLQTESVDGGKTWTQLRMTEIVDKPPHLIRMASGYILVTYGRRRAPFGQRACVSRDNGKTWDMENEIILRDDAIDSDLGYPASVQLDDESIYTVYYQIDKPGEKPCIMGTHWQLPAMYTKAGRAAADKFLGSGARVRELDLGPRIDARVAEDRSEGKEKSLVVGCIRGVNLDKQTGSVVSVPNPNVPEQKWTFGSQMEEKTGMVTVPGLSGKATAYDAEGKVLKTCSRESISLPFSREPVYLVSEDMSARDMEKALKNAAVEGITLTESQAYVGNLDGKTGLVIESRRQTGGAASAQICCSIESASEGLVISERRSALEVRVGKEERTVIPFDRITPTDGRNLKLHYTIAEQGFPSVVGHAMVGVAVKMEKPPEINGSSEEWKGVPATVIPGTTLYSKLKTWRGPEDLSARMKLGWDNEALYFLVEVRDDVYMQLAEENKGKESVYFYASDSIELCFDRARINTSELFNPADILKCTIAAQVVGCKGAQYGVRNGGGLKVASTMKKGGYVLEGSIPWKENFPGVKVQEGLAIPFDVKVNDRDENEPADRQLWDTDHTQSLIWCSPTAGISGDASGYGAVMLMSREANKHDSFK